MRVARQYGLEGAFTRGNEETAKSLLLSFKEDKRWAGGAEDSQEADTGEDHVVLIAFICTAVAENVGAIRAFASVDMNEKLKRRVMGVGYRAVVLLLRHRSMRRISAWLERRNLELPLNKDNMLTTSYLATLFPGESHLGIWMGAERAIREALKALVIISETEIHRCTQGLIDTLCHIKHN